MIKKTTLFALICLFPFIALSQGLTNNGAKITIGSGKYVTISGASGDITNQNSGTVNLVGNMAVQGDWTNNATFTTASGAVTFNGSATQNIKSGSGSFHKVVFNNTTSGTTDINLTDPMTITDSGVFINGIVYFTGTGALSFTDGAVSPGGGTATSFVNTTGNAVVTKSGTNGFIFPIGEVSGGNVVWAPVEIAAPALNSTISANYDFSSSPNNWEPGNMCDLSQIDHTSGVEHWRLTTTASSPDVTLYWKDGARSGITTLPDLLVARWTGSCWQPMATSALTGSVASGSLKTNFPFSSNDTITFGTKKNSNPLPVSLLDFNAECIDKGVTLEWATASETNNDFFTIEKSDNATDWEKLGEVDGAGNSTIRTNYSFTDNNNANTAKYYRLKQTDFNGEYKYFTPLAIECGGMDNMNVEIYPNPFQQQVYLNISNLSTPIVHVTICNIVGKVIYEQHFDNIQGQRLFASFNLQDMDCGMYFIEVNCGANKRNYKIVKDQKE